jgi:membrane glycosyltransferase
VDVSVEAGNVNPQGIDLVREARLRRAGFFGLTLVTASLCTALMFDILNANGLSVAERISLPLFFALIAWISGAFWTAIAGFVIRVSGADPAALSAARVSDVPLNGRTALIICVYNEDVARVSAGLDAIWSSLMRERDGHAFDLFILSDTRKADVAAAEEAAWLSLVTRLDARGRIFYRRRAQNTGRKAGNVADFVRNWGGAYDYMVVLDADSVMSGKALVTLARLMDANPTIGIVQTLPMPAGCDTIFARMIQFAARLSSPMLSSGLSYWQLGESNYYGHNAIIRMRAFAQHCALPKLPGREPLGGEILSHDFVEAAFIRRAGYGVWMVPDLDGSWEQVPTNVIDYAARDRRWAQGNLQHIRVMPARGLHWLSRIHLVTGVMSYASSPMWFAVLVLSSIVACVDAVRGPVYFEPGAYTLFPSWPESRTVEISGLLCITLVLLLLPKVLGATLAFRDRALLAGFGGPVRLTASLLAEQIFSMLLAPAMMLFHSWFVIRTLCGKGIGWNTQDRSERGISLSEAYSRHKWHLGLGLAWGTTVMTLAPKFIWWMAPVLVGMLVAIPLAVITSRRTLGRRLRSWGLFLTPEESSPPRELVAALGASPHVAQAPVAAPVAASVPQLATLRMEPAPLIYVMQRTPEEQSEEEIARGGDPV